jgi:hypothetical protein
MEGKNFNKGYVIRVYWEVIIKVIAFIDMRLVNGVLQIYNVNWPCMNLCT